MYRSKLAVRFLLAPALFMLVVSVLGCTGSAEQPLIQKYFQATKLRDNLTLANIATVSFDQGVVQSFSITAVTPETTKPVRLKELTKAHLDAVAADTEFTKKKKEYQDANSDAINRILKTESAKKKLAGKDLEIQAAWNKWREETAKYAKAASDAREKLNAERPILDVSLPNNDVSGMDGEVATKEVTLDANVKMADGKDQQKTLVLVLQQARMKKTDGTALEGRWIITGIKEAGAAATKTS
jgi:hypothetical protein